MLGLRELPGLAPDKVELIEYYEHDFTPFVIQCAGSCGADPRGSGVELCYILRKPWERSRNRLKATRTRRTAARNLK